MALNPSIASLHDYPFTRLARLLDGVEPPAGMSPIPLSVGEPKHEPPAFVVDALRDSLGQLNRYPLTAGSPELRAAIAAWLERRFLDGREIIDPATMVLPVQGTREALFALAQVIVDRDAADAPAVMLPSPFYQIYEGAAIMAGAEPLYLPCKPDKGFLPDYDAVSADDWRRCQLLYICNPNNPTGVVHGLDNYRRLLELADEYDFVIASDECYSEIYYDEAAPPLGFLSACEKLGRSDFRRAIVFNSLSKRSSVPGLRSGLVAGDPDIIASFLTYRTYHGFSMPLHHQQASIAAWQDESHVIANRVLYREKFDAMVAGLGSAMTFQVPAGGFCLWPDLGAYQGGDEQFARELFAAIGVTVLPGSYLARDIGGSNPGAGRVRMALVFPLEQCAEAADRIYGFLQG